MSRQAHHLRTVRVTFENSERVERVRATQWRDVPPLVEFVVEEGEGLAVRFRVVASFTAREIARITTV